MHTYLLFVYRYWSNDVCINGYHSFTLFYVVLFLFFVFLSTYLFVFTFRPFRCEFIGSPLDPLHLITLPPIILPPIAIPPTPLNFISQFNTPSTWTPPSLPTPATTTTNLPSLQFLSAAAPCIERDWKEQERMEKNHKYSPKSLPFTVPPLCFVVA